jgi:hypothetical protein
MLFNQNRGRPKVELDYPYNMKPCGGQIFFSHFKWIPSREEHDNVVSFFPPFDVALMCWDSKILKSFFTVQLRCYAIDLSQVQIH